MNGIQKFKTNHLNYHTRFLNLLNQIYQCYETLIKNEDKIICNENKIRNLLVDDYLNKSIKGYDFRKEEFNKEGRVDIYIVEKITKEKPQFIIECKLLNDNNLLGTTGLNAEYVQNGILRFLREHYYAKGNFKTNAMIGFIIKDINIEKNIDNINKVSNKLLNNLVDIKKPLSLEDNFVYKSTYYTYNNKHFILYHLMLDFVEKVAG